MSCVDALEFTAFPRLEWTPVTLSIKNLPMLIATISAVDQRGKVNFLDSDNNEQPALVEVVFLDELIVICTTRLVHQQCCIILFLFECMSWFNKCWSTTGRILSCVIDIESEHPSQLDLTSQRYISSQRYIPNNVTLKKRQKPNSRCTRMVGRARR